MPPLSNEDHRPAAAGCSRRHLLKLAASAPLAAGLGSRALAAPAQVAAAGIGKNRRPDLEPRAGRWRTWLVPSTRTFLPPPPPRPNSAQARAELQELLVLQAQRGDAVRALVQYWDAQGGLPVWTQVLLEKIRETRTDPVRAARALALFHTALADASIVAWNAKFTYFRVQPSVLNRRLTSLSSVERNLPAYVSEHAAIAAAAAAVLEYLYPGQAASVHGQQLSFADAAREAALSRLSAGACFRSDVEAGLTLGEAVGALAVRRGQGDGSGAVWDPVTQPGRPAPGPQYWVPTAPANVFPPLHA
ncbi:MAG TPA: phosphatase PAP2 family protein, partial [Armatimonadota bacterium]|nr:phosphatase PAP2 family protein [Armatimonadota bacterium]